MKSIDLSQGVIKPRSGVKKGTRYFTRAEKIRQVLRDKERRENRGLAESILEEAKRKVRDERDRKAAMLEAVKAKRRAGVDPTLPIQYDKEGRAFVQPHRVKGRFQKRVVLG